MTARRTSRAGARALALVSLAAPLAAVFVAGTAPAALAAVSVSWSDPTPSSNAVVTGGSDVAAKVTVGSGTRPQITLTITPPGGLSPRTGAMAACTQSLTHSCPSGSISVTYPLAASGVPVPNGQWTASATGSTTITRTFFTNVAPAATPGDVTAKATNPAAGATTGTIDLSWTYAGAETDLWGYRVEDGNGGSFDVSAADAGCASGGTCHTSKQYDNAPGSTTSYAFSVAALRKSCKADGCSVSSETVQGDASSPASAQLVTPQPPPSPTPGPSSPGTSSGGSGTGAGGGSGSTAGGTTGGSGAKPGAGGKKGSAIVIPTLNPVVAQRRAFALGFNNFSPSLGIPKLPPLPATTFPETVGGSADSYQPTLPYKAQPRTTTSILTSPLGAVRNLDTQQLAKNLAVALVLLMTAAHVRLFLKAHRPE